MRRALIAVLLAVVLTAVGAIQVIRVAQPPPVDGAGRYDATQMMGSCPATRQCFLRQGVGPVMDASAKAAFPAMAVTSASSLIDAATEELVAQRMTMTNGTTRAILWVIEQHGAARMRMMYQTVELGARTVVSAWPVDGSTMRGATVLLFGSSPDAFPVDAAREWVRTPGLYD